MKPNVDETHDPSRRSWVRSAYGHPNFPIQNLPFGVFAPTGGTPRIGVAIGDSILDLQALSRSGHLPIHVLAALEAPILNGLLALSASERVSLRRRISELLSNEAESALVAPFLHEDDVCTLHLPAKIGDYSDFYVGIHHAKNVGAQFRPDQPLLPNYKHVPIGYHGRASSIRPSGAQVVRPRGQTRSPEAAEPSFGLTRRLDYEVELGVWIGGACNTLGQPISIETAERSIAGFCLLNDWSARDMQAWEYQPLGPFLSKSFHTTISPWMITSEAMAPFRIAQPSRAVGDPTPLPYLWSDRDQAGGALGVEIQAYLLTAKMREAGVRAHALSVVQASNMYWTVAQIVTHHTSGGCNLNAGDLLGTGTISADEKSGYGSFLEITRGGTEPIILHNGETRGFLEDGDEIVFAATARAPGYVPIGFGECRGRVSPAPFWMDSKQLRGLHEA